MSIDPRIIAKLITEDPDRFNEAYAKHLLNEIVDPGNTDLGDIEVREIGPRTIYNFSDPRHDSAYIVEFSTKRYYNHFDVNSLDNAQVVYIVLKIDDDNRFAATGKGNFAFVYSRLMTCVVDYFHTRGNDQEVVQFSGYSTDMDSVYNKIIDRLAKKYPDRVYYPYRESMYISKSAIDNIEDDDAKMQILQAIDNQTKMLKSEISSYKSDKRRRAMDRLNKPAVPRWNYDSSIQDNSDGEIDSGDDGDRFDAYNDPEYSGFSCPISGEPLSMDEIQNPLYHPVTGAELETDEEVEAARQWYRSRMNG